MPHPAHHAPAAAVLMAGHPGGLPPGEGTVVETDSDETGAGQRSLLVVGQPRISLSSVVTSAETAHRRPRSGTCERSSALVWSGL
jgi:hypothetical protein